MVEFKSQTLDLPHVLARVVIEPKYFEQITVESLNSVIEHVCHLLSQQISLTISQGYLKCIQGEKPFQN